MKAKIETKQIQEATYEIVYNNIKNSLSLNGKPTATFYEVIKGRCRGYVDMDCGEFENKEIYLENRKSFIGLIREKLAGREYILFDGSGKIGPVKFKASFHIIFPTLYFNCGFEMVDFIKSLNLPHVDMSVYKKEGKAQLFRIPYNAKNEIDLRPIYKLTDENKRVPFEKLTPEDFKDFLITQPEIKDFKNDDFSDCSDDDDDDEVEIEEPEQKYEDQKYEDVDTSNNEDDNEIKKEAVEELVIKCLLDKDGRQEMHWETWAHLIFCLRNIADVNDYDLRRLAHDFSKLSKKYNIEETDKTYNASATYRGRKLQLGSLIQWAKDHNEDAYFEWKTKWQPTDFNLRLLRSPFCDGDIADWFRDVCGDDFIYYENKLYMFNGNFWEIETPAIIYKKIDELYWILFDLLRKKFSGDEHKDFFSACSKNMLKLRTTKQLSNQYEAIKHRIFKNEDLFDRNADLLGFTNGTYELNNGLFREGRREDYIAMVINYDYAVVEVGVMGRLMDFWRKVMPIEEELNFLLKCLATGLRGQTLEKFIVLIGEGGNGKDVVKDLMKATLGTLYYEASSSAITQKVKGDMSVSIRSMHKKRTVWYNEPSATESIQCDQMKILTGGGSIPIRGLYEKTTDTILHGTNIVSLNTFPKLSEVNEAINRRLIAILFRSLFRSEEEMKRDFPDGGQYLYVGDNYYKTPQFGEDFKLPMMNLLLEHYKIFQSEGCILKGVPQSCVDLAKEYMASSDEFYGWLMSAYQKGDSMEEYVQIKDVFAKFKGSEFYQDLPKQKKRTYTLKKLIDEITKNPNLRPYYKERYTYRIDGTRKEVRNVLLKFKEIEYVAEEED